MIQGISHLTFVVRDLELAARFFVEFLGAREVYASGARTFSHAPEKFFTAGGLWLAAMQGEPRQERSYDHAAFSVREEDLDRFEQKALALGLEIRPPRPRLPGEGRSLYVHDYDGHLFELHAGALDERLARYAAGPPAAHAQGGAA